MPVVKNMPSGPVSIFRSEAMTLAQLYLQADAAYNCVSELGELVRFILHSIIYSFFSVDCVWESVPLNYGNHNNLWFYLAYEYYY